MQPLSAQPGALLGCRRRHGESFDNRFAVCGLAGSGRRPPRLNAASLGFVLLLLLAGATGCSDRFASRSSTPASRTHKA
jgi:hypothetical protein